MRARLGLFACALSLAPAIAMAAAASAPAGPPHARAVAGLDLTGQWVAIVTEDWRWRMVTPPKGDLTYLPLNAEGRRVAMTWDLAADNASGAQCKAWGPGGLIRQPTRLRFSWADDNTLKFESDSGQQTRLFKFVAPAPGPIYPALTEAYPPTGSRTLQGESRSQWFGYPQSRGLGFGAQRPSASAVRVVTRNHTGGYLRKNGAPYSENAVITEHFNRHDYPDGEAWLTVTTIVEDPRYLTEPMVTTTSFRKETDTSKWNPRPCFTPPPLAAPAASPAGGGFGP